MDPNQQPYNPNNQQPQPVQPQQSAGGQVFEPGNNYSPEDPFKMNNPYADPNFNNSQVVRTEVYDSPSLANNPPYGGQNQNPAQQGQTNKTSDPRKRIPFIIGGALLFILLIVIIIVAVVSGGNNKPATTQKPQEQTNTTDLPASLQPIQAIEVEQTNNSLNQDLSTVDDDKDFPVNKLDDRSIGL